MSKSSPRISIMTVGLHLLLSGAFVCLLNQPAQAGFLLGPTDIKVKKTASVVGTVVSGTISIKNEGKNPAVITSIVDSLEVRFPKGVTPPPLLPGSDTKWFQAALVPGLQAVPNPIPVGETVIISYSFDTCEADNYTGADKMRNVVSVTLGNGPKGLKTITQHSPDFVPPSQAGCPFCGDGSANRPSEDCDGSDLRGLDCSSVPGGFTGGTLACTASCTLDTSGCSTCGNDIVEGQEACDGPDLNGQDCTSLGQGFTGGVLACTGSCTFDTSNCSTCGNGVVEGQEACDGTNLNGETCTSQGFDGGRLACTPSCTFDTSNCTTCGNDIVEGQEACDGTNLNGETCTSQGFAGGSLACTPFCTFDTSACFNE